MVSLSLIRAVLDAQPEIGQMSVFNLKIKLLFPSYFLFLKKVYFDRGKDTVRRCVIILIS